jgi:uncharacterized membrane protein
MNALVMTTRHRSGRRLAQVTIFLAWAVAVCHLMLTVLGIAAGLSGGRADSVAISTLPPVLLLLGPVLLGGLLLACIAHAAVAVFDIADRQH